jgi:L-ascorbate metabolism protein UlaG (beta-lactamase superfamily)
MADVRQVAGVAVVAILIVVVAPPIYFGFLFVPSYNPPGNSTTTTTTTTATPIEAPPPEPPEGLYYDEVEIYYLAIMGFKLKHAGLVVYIDPVNCYAGENETFLEPADYILVSHVHPTHFSTATIGTISDNDTIVMSSRLPAERLNPDYIVEPGDVLEFDGVTFEFVSSYSPGAFHLGTGQPMHQKSSNNTGVIVDFEGPRIYHAADTARYPEMQTFDVDIAIFPVSNSTNKAWMNASEAAKAVDDLKINSDLKYTIPAHWDIGAGFIWERRYYAEEFAALANCTVVILDHLY